MSVDDKIAWLAVHISRWPQYQVDLWLIDGALVAEERGKWTYRDHGTKRYIGCVQKYGQDWVQIAISIRAMVHEHYRSLRPKPTIWSKAA